jgi:alpha-tubulin suppressor-like RCC1 family protein
MRFMHFLFLVLSVACNQIEVELKNSGQDLGRSQASFGRVNAAVVSSTYPLTLDFSGLKAADQIFVLSGSGTNCLGGIDVGYDFSIVDGGMVSTHHPQDLSGTIRVLVINGSERLCSSPMSYDLAPTFKPIAIERRMPNPQLPLHDPVTGEVNSSYITTFSVNSKLSCSIQENRTVKCWGEGSFGQFGSGTNSFRPDPVEVIGLTEAQSVSTDGIRACASKLDGTVWCWGFLVPGAAQRFMGFEDITSVSLGTNQTCAIKSDGTLWCGSDALWVAPSQVIGIDNAVSVSSLGGSSFCALISDGEVKCRFGNQFSPIQSISLGNVVSLLGRISNICALQSDGTVWCWEAGSLPVQIDGLSGVVGIAVSGLSFCSLRSDGTVWCWESGLIPAQIQGVSGAVGISIGGRAACAQLSSADLVCWGENTTSSPRTAHRSLGNVTDIAGHGNAICLLIEGRVRCAGWGGYLGYEAEDRYQNYSYDNSQTLLLADVQKIKAGGYHFCALDADQEFYCWGDNYEGQLGVSNDNEYFTPQPVFIPGDVVDFALSSDSTCAVNNLGELYCWGKNFTFDPLKRVELDGKFIVNVWASQEWDQICAKSNDSKIYCFGPNDGSQLAFNPSDQDEFTEFTEIPNLTGAINLVFTSYQGCGIFGEERELRCFGQNWLGELGVDPNVVFESDTPIPIGITGVDDVFFDGWHLITYYIKDSRLFAIGSDGNHEPLDYPLGGLKKGLHIYSRSPLYTITHDGTLVIQRPLNESAQEQKDTFIQDKRIVR